MIRALMVAGAMLVLSAAAVQAQTPAAPRRRRRADRPMSACCPAQSFHPIAGR
nr:hypothetical protein [uncultured Brevundimonas sp.]